MSFLKRQPLSSDAACACTDQAPQATFRMKIQPIPGDVRSLATHDETVQLMNAERLQDTFLPTLGNVPAHEHGNGFHVHPEAHARVAHVAQLHDLLDEHNLVARISLAPKNDDTTVAAQLTREHIDELMEKGIADVAVPLEQGTFRLHSDRPGRITAVEYVSGVK